MSNINLLPWREEQKRNKKTIFFIILTMTCLVVLFTCYLGKVFIDLKIEAQVKRNHFLQTEMHILDKQIAEIERIETQKNELERRINLIQRLEQKRNAATRLFNVLPEITPNGVYLTAVNFSHEQIKITGLTESNEQVSQLVRNIEKTKWLTDVSLPSIVSGSTQPIKLSKFSMNFFVFSNQGQR
ncbi:PilN domain-containing protein [Psychromonas algicola]|uniref:PilN domain-containing protein n=1 Tax=Psychromonas algicola TaxID=2555642 RepID=UPI0010687091|nr:PilN domain-containing protein [Psychromonas sp. RZ5]TEW52719.1 pilus assembly protein PilN [Psychromonas sp. RZ5]